MGDVSDKQWPDHIRAKIIAGCDSMKPEYVESEKARLLQVNKESAYSLLYWSGHGGFCSSLPLTREEQRIIFEMGNQSEVNDGINAEGAQGEKPAQSPERQG